MSYSNKKFESNDWLHFGFDVWYKVENVRNLKKRLSNMRASNKVYLSKSKHDGMAIDDLADSYLKASEVKNANSMKYKKYEDGKGPTGKKHKKRFGSYFLIHLGKDYSMQFQIKILNEFLKQVCYGEEHLPYYATTSKNRNEVYIHLWICDREFLKDEPRIYESDYWQKDGKRCKANTEDGVLLHKAGESILNDDGTVKMLNGWKQNKTRIFAENWKTSTKRWRDAFVAVFYCVLRRINPMLKFELIPLAYDVDYVYDKAGNLKEIKKRKRAREFIFVNREDKEWKNIKYREIASLQYFVKYVIHELMSGDIDNYRSSMRVGWNEHITIDFKDPPTRFSIELRDLFNEYNSIFNDWKFINDRTEEVHDIMFCFYQDAISNLRILREQFKRQINTILKKYKPALAY